MPMVGLVAVKSGDAAHLKPPTELIEDDKTSFRTDSSMRSSFPTGNQNNVAKVATGALVGGVVATGAHAMGSTADKEMVQMQQKKINDL
jgi:hypothetical protein